MEAVVTNKEPTAKPEAAEDRTGRSRLVSNVLFTWGGQMIFFVSGFIMPRMIDHKLGQDVLGVWDFSWALIAYFKFVDMGVTASVNRYVARYWGKHEIEGINRVLSSATFALCLAALFIFIGTIVAVILLPHWHGMHSVEYLAVTQKSVFCLGCMLAGQTALGAFNGVLTGCHRWELQTVRTVVAQSLTLLAMLVALWLGYGLVMLAAITALGQMIGQLTTVSLAYHACPGLSLKRSYINKSTIKELYIYSGKTLLPTLSEMLLNQTITVLITGSLGLASLAVFTRPRSLLRQMDSLERKMGMILIPTTSSLEGKGDFRAIGALMTKSVRYSLYLSLPLIFVMVVFGGMILNLWMGPAYALNLLPAILAIGFVGMSVQEPVLSILIGLNAHGRGGVAGLVAAGISVLMALAMVHWMGASLVGMAVAVVLPQMVMSLVYLPWLACRHLGLGYWKFLRDAMLKPMLPLVPFAMCLGVARWLYAAHLGLAVLVAGLGCVILGLFYWQSVLPDKLKRWVLRPLPKQLRGNPVN